MRNFDLDFEYNLNFSKNGCFDKEKNKDNAFDNFLKKILKSNNKHYKPMVVDYQKIEDFYIIIKYLKCIAVENCAIMKIKMVPDDYRICIELESETLDFDSDKLKSIFAEILRLTTSVCFESHLNGKIYLIVETTIF